MRMRRGPKKSKYNPLAPPSTSTNLAFSTTCPTETKDKISKWDMAAASFNKKTATNEIQQNKKVTNLAYQKGSHTH